MKNLVRQLRDYRLTTALITYRMPDYQSILQEYLWQNLDLPPHYPKLEQFLNFWQNNLDGPLHSVEIASARLIKPAQFRVVDHLGMLH